MSFNIQGVLTTPPILKLDCDILLYILEIIAPWNPSPHSNPLKSPPLTDIRRISQVCQTWRDLLLRLPSIWARCIHLDFMDQQHSRWRDLVIQRTGGSLLSVTAWQTLRAYGVRSGFLIDLLNTNWTRIRYFNVCIDPSMLNDARIWKALGRLANNLQIFSISTLESHLPIVTRLQLPHDFKLFSNHAPSLTQLFLPRSYGLSPNIQVREQTVVRSLRHLSICYAGYIDCVDLLAACMQMQLLESLSMTLAALPLNVHPSEIRSSLRPSMPRLKEINITSPTFEIYHRFLRHLVPHPGCALYICHTLDGTGKAIPTKDMEDIQLVLSKYSKSYFDYYKADETFCQRAILVLSPDYELKISSDDPTPVGIELTNCSRLPVENYQKLLNTLVLSFKFPSTVRHLQLFIDPPFRIGQVLQVDIALGLTQFLQNMSSIDTLTTTAGNISYLAKLPTGIFPCLKTINMERTYFFCSIRSNTKSIMEFFEQRQSTAPVGTLNIIGSWPLGDYRDFEKISGLKVTWTADGGTLCEYVCGTGNVESLFLGDLLDFERDFGQWFNPSDVDD